MTSYRNRKSDPQQPKSYISAYVRTKTVLQSTNRVLSLSQVSRTTRQEKYVVKNIWKIKLLGIPEMEHPVLFPLLTLTSTAKKAPFFITWGRSLFIYGQNYSITEQGTRNIVLYYFTKHLGNFINWVFLRFLFFFLGYQENHQITPSEWSERQCQMSTD